MLLKICCDGLGSHCAVKLNVTARLLFFAVWEVFTGRVAFHGLHYGEVFEQVALWQKRPPVPEDMPADYATLMTECWSADPFRRPAFDAVEARLREMLDRTVQDEREAQDRFVSDL